MFEHEAAGPVFKLVHKVTYVIFVRIFLHILPDSN